MQQIPVVLYLDGQAEPQRVVVDQRDFARAEAAGYFDHDDRKVTRTRYLAWSAAKRAGVTKATWQKFNDDECVHAEVEDDEDDGGGDALDPGRPDQSDAA